MQSMIAQDLTIIIDTGLGGDALPDTSPYCAFATFWKLTTLLSK